MILKFWGILYNLEGWKKIYFEYADGTLYSEPNEICVDLDPNDDATYIARKHEDWDHKDERQLWYRITSKAYNKIIDKLLDKTEYYDLDADYQQILKDAEDELVKEFEEYDEE